MLWAQSTTKGYTQGWTQTSVYRQVTHSTQIILPQVFFSQTTAQILASISERKNQKNNNTYFGTYLHSWALSTVGCLVGGLSPANHEELHQGWTQTSVYLQVIHSTSLFFSLEPQLRFYPQFRNAKPEKQLTHVFEPIHIPRALNTGTCIQQGDLFYSAGLRRNWC